MAREAGLIRCLVMSLLVLLLGVQSFRFAEHFRKADSFYQALLERFPLHTAAWTNYGWHKLYMDKDPEAAERILLSGIEAVEGFRNQEAKMDFMHNLMVLYLENGRPLEAETMMQCIMESWVVRPEGNTYFWHLVRLRQNLAKDPGRRRGNTLDQGG